MLRHIICAISFFCLAASTQAAIIITQSPGVEVPGLPGYRSYTITATSNVSGELIQGVDFAGDGSNDPATGKGFFGAMNQIGPPVIDTTYQDNNSLIPLLNPGHTAAEDSQFLINSGAANIAHPNGLDEEGPNILQGIWAWTEPQGQSVDFARLVLPNSGIAVKFRGSFSLNTPQGIVDTPSINGPGCLGCVPPTFASPTINNVDSENPGFIDYIFPIPPQGASFGNLQFDSYAPAPGVTGAGPVTAATFDSAQRKFHWDTIGSPLGSYKWLITATNNYGVTDGSITVNVTVPEPPNLGTLAIAIAVSLIYASSGRRSVF